MGTTGLIFGAIVLAWLAYLVPMYLRRQGSLLPAMNPADRFSSQVRIVRDSHAPTAEVDDDEDDQDVEVSTPLTRRAAVAEIRLEARRAAGRRRNTLAVLTGVFVLLTLLSAVRVTPWWTLAIPGVLIVVFVVIARFSVVAMERTFERRLDALKRVDNEDTISIKLPDALAPAPEAEHSIEIVAPVSSGGALWDPVPVTQPTYVQTPLSPRTVRTIDLSAPVAPVLAEPVTADVDAEERDLPRAVGE